MRPVAVVDTNVVVAALLTADAASPTARILAAMLAADFVFLLSEELLAEYRGVLLRGPIATRHGLSADEVDELLVALVAHGTLRRPGPASSGPRGDEHLFALLATDQRALLVSGDAAVLRRAGERGRSPAAFVERP